MSNEFQKIKADADPNANFIANQGDSVRMTTANHSEFEKHFGLMRTASLLNLKPADKKAPFNYLPPSRSKTTLGFTSTKQMAKEKNMLKHFQIHHDKLREGQSNFLAIWDNMKDVKSDEVKRSHQFIAMAINETIKFLVNDDDLLRIPKNIPSNSLGFLKESIKKSLLSAVVLLDKHYADNPSILYDRKWKQESEAIRKLIKELQENLYGKIEQRLDTLCKNLPNEELVFARTLQELHETKSKFEKYMIEKEIEQAELIAQQNRELAEVIKCRKDAQALTLLLRKQDLAEEEEIKLKKAKLEELQKEKTRLEMRVFELKESRKKMIRRKGITELSVKQSQ